MGPSPGGYLWMDLSEDRKILLSPYVVERRVDGEWQPGLLGDDGEAAFLGVVSWEHMEDAILQAEKIASERDPGLRLVAAIRLQMEPLAWAFSLSLGLAVLALTLLPASVSPFVACLTTWICALGAYGLSTS